MARQMKTTQGSNETMNCGKSTHQADSLTICRMVMIRGRSFQWDAKKTSDAIAVRHSGRNLFKKA